MITLEESRYDRAERITWWDQAKLRGSSVLVVGAGALGNEIVKNLTLVGVGSIEVVDMDVIEHSNLSRCVFFKDGDEGRYKAELLAERAGLLNPDVNLSAHVVPVQRLGLGFLRKFDLVIGGLDNREARLWIGQACRKLNMYWVDGAIEGLQGLARVFAPEGPCYECTLGEIDRQVMAHRKSCALLTSAEVNSGRTPTNATTSSVIAGVQTQEAVKILTGNYDLVSLSGKAWVFAGDSMLSYIIDYDEDEMCMSHDTYLSVVGPIDLRPDAQLNTCLNEVANGLDFVPSAVDFEDDLIHLEACPSCSSTQKRAFRSALGAGDGECPSCGELLNATSVTSIEWGSDALTVNWFDWNPPNSDVVTLRSGDERVHVILNAGVQ
jgi:molybdopterin/thiamine biosynthesis adenylyltransferase